MATLTGCPGPTVDGITPATATQFGDVEVTITGANFQSGAKVVVGGVEALFAQVVDAGTIHATVQGAPVPGPADVTVTNPDNSGATAAGIFTYTPPTDPLFERVIGLGASYSAGIQSNSFAGRAQLTGPLAHLMRAAGAYFPMPITKGAGLPPLLGPESVVVSDGTPLVHPITGQVVNVPAGEIFNPAENINSTEILLPYILDQILPEVLAHPFDPPLYALRETGSVRASNISVPAGLMDDTIMGERFGISALAWAIIDPTKDLVGSLASLAPSPLKEIADRDPTLVISTDLYGIDVALRGDIPMDTFRSFLFYILLDLSTSNYYTQPGAAGEWPGVPFKRKDTGETVLNPFNEAEYDEYDLVIDYEALELPNLGDMNGNGRIDESEVDLAAVFADDDPSDNPQAIVLGTIPTAPEIFDGPIIPSRNAAALELAALFPNVHMYDSADLIEPILDEARGVAPPDILDVDDDGDLDVYLHEFGGVRSLDGLHLTSTGYAFLANIFIERMNATLGTHVPEIDLAGVFAEDPLAPCNFTPDVRAIVGTPEENCP
ncbi:MAG: IPT/TIG domain-containing protein [Myxococcales bacterium]|nr:IPT/TIG domain-containing protein [Myxococcales bacterium]